VPFVHGELSEEGGGVRPDFAGESGEFFVV
jgi:hypothetical protein